MGFRSHGPLVLLLLAAILVGSSMGQLDASKSYFLLTGQLAGSITLVSLSSTTHNLTMPTHSDNIPIQALTDTVNSRFVVLSGLTAGALGVNYTFSNISYTQMTLSPINTFTLPSNMHLVDSTYDLSLKIPVSLIRSNDSCFLLNGYGPVGNNELQLTQLETCHDATTVGAVLAENRLVTVSNEVVNGVRTATFCVGGTTGPLDCQPSSDTAISNLIGSTANPVFFPTVFSKGNSTWAGIYSATTRQLRYLSQLKIGKLGDNDHMPTYWDPVYLVFAGAWKLSPTSIQIFAATYPAQGWFSPAPGFLPQGNLIGLALAYKPVVTPVAIPVWVAPVKPPASKTGLIVGAVIGGVAAIALFIGFFIFIRRSFSFQYRRIPDH